MQRYFMHRQAGAKSRIEFMKPKARSAEGAEREALRAEPEGRSLKGGARRAEAEGQCRMQTTSGRFNIKPKCSDPKVSGYQNV